MYSKGSDTSIKSMLAPGQELQINAVELQEEQFARKGLRTLYFGYKPLQVPDYMQVEGTGWDALRVEDVESNLILLGATGTEDLL